MPSTPTTYGQTVWTGAEYDAPRRRLVPSLDLLYGPAADRVAAAMPAGVAVDMLDLGAGTGLLS